MELGQLLTSGILHESEVGLLVVEPNKGLHIGTAVVSLGELLQTQADLKRMDVPVYSVGLATPLRLRGQLCVSLYPINPLAAAAADTGWKKARGIGGLLGTLANAAQADKALDHVATPEQVADLLVAASECIDELVHTLSDWDSEYRGDGTVSTRDFRRALPLHGIFVERHVSEALFHSLMPAPDAAAYEEASASGRAAATPGSGATAGQALAATEGSRPPRERKEASKQSKAADGLGPLDVWSLRDHLKSSQKIQNGGLRLIDLFHAMDTNQSGSLSREEFTAALKKFGYVNATDEEVAAVMDVVDADRSGSVMFKEMSTLLLMLGPKPHTEPEPEPEAPVISTAGMGEPKMEIWVLDRGIRWGIGSKAKRSSLFKNPSGLFRDSSKSVAEQLRDALVANAMRVIDLFRDWDTNGDGKISISEFKRAIPKLGLIVHPAAIEMLFEEFDLDHGGT